MKAVRAATTHLLREISVLHWLQPDFLELNGVPLSASDEECVLLTLAVVAGHNSETETADWIRKRVVKVV